MLLLFWSPGGKGERASGDKQRQAPLQEAMYSSSNLYNERSRNHGFPFSPLETPWVNLPPTSRSSAALASCPKRQEEPVRASIGEVLGMTGRSPPVADLERTRVVRRRTSAGTSLRLRLRHSHVSLLLLRLRLLLRLPAAGRGRRRGGEGNAEPLG